MKPFFLHPLFALGLLIRLALIAGLAPLTVVDWYAPFLDASIAHLGLDPWSTWLADGGTPAAFPYGYAMWVAFLPLTIAAKLLGLKPILAYALTLLVCDVLLLFVLQRLLPDRIRLLLAAYWLSPIVILASYGLGLNDLIPVLVLTLSIHFTRSHQLRLAGALCAAAISAKVSMVVALRSLPVLGRRHPHAAEQPGDGQNLRPSPGPGQPHRRLYRAARLPAHALFRMAYTAPELRALPGHRGPGLSDDRFNDARLARLVRLEHPLPGLLPGDERAHGHRPLGGLLGPLRAEHPD
jgi:hypothetical protein